MRLSGRYLGTCIITFILVVTFKSLIFLEEVNILFKKGISKEEYLRNVKKSEFVQNVSFLIPNATIKNLKKITISAEEFRKYSYIKTGNVLIDNYGSNNNMHNGENGRGVTFVGEEKKKVKELLKKHRINVLASDIIPLNRLVPDSRPHR